MALFPEDVAAMNQMRARVPDFSEGLMRFAQALAQHQEMQRQNAPLAGPQQNLADELQRQLGVPGQYDVGSQGPPLLRAPPEGGSQLGEAPSQDMSGPLGRLGSMLGIGQGDPGREQPMRPMPEQEPIRGSPGTYSLPKFTNRQWAESGDTLKMLAGLRGKEMSLEGVKYRADASRHVQESRAKYQMIKEGRVADKAARETAMSMWKNGQSQKMALERARDELLKTKASVLTDPTQYPVFVQRMDEITNQIRDLELENQQWADMLEEYATGMRTDPSRSTSGVTGTFDKETGTVTKPAPMTPGSRGGVNEPSYTGRGQANGMKTPIVPSTRQKAGGAEAAADNKRPGSVNSTGKTSEGGTRTNSGGAHPIDTTVAIKEPSAERPEVQDALARSKKSGVFRGPEPKPAPPPVSNADQYYTWAKGLSRSEREREIARRLLQLKEERRKALPK